jgi:hypothetical protein
VSQAAGNAPSRAYQPIMRRVGRTSVCSEQKALRSPQPTVVRTPEVGGTPQLTCSQPSHPKHQRAETRG